MPIYEFRCPKCGHTVERGDREAPMCCKRRMVRLWHPPAIAPFPGSTVGK